MKGCHPPLRKTTQPLCEHGMNPCCDVCALCRIEESISRIFERILEHDSDIKCLQKKISLHEKTSLHEKVKDK